MGATTRPLSPAYVAFYVWYKGGVHEVLTPAPWVDAIVWEVAMERRLLDMSDYIQRIVKVVRDD